MYRFISLKRGELNQLNKPEKKICDSLKKSMGKMVLANDTVHSRSFVSHFQARPCRILDHFRQTFDSERRTFMISTCTEPICNSLCLLSWDHARSRMASISEIGFTANEEDRDVRSTKFAYFWVPLVPGRIIVSNDRRMQGGKKVGGSMMNAYLS